LIKTIYFTEYKKSSIICLYNFFTAKRGSYMPNLSNMKKYAIKGALIGSGIGIMGAIAAGVGGHIGLSIPYSRKFNQFYMEMLNKLLGEHPECQLEASWCDMAVAPHPCKIVVCSNNPDLGQEIQLTAYCYAENQPSLIAEHNKISGLTTALVAAGFLIPVVAGATFGVIYGACKTPTAETVDEESPLIAADNIQKDTSRGFCERVSNGATSCFSYFFSRSEKTSVITEQTAINADEDNPFVEQENKTFNL
jgi:hypothetical protein